MVHEPGEWTIPAPLRALLWWPPIAFALAVLQPSAAATVIASTGAGLAVLGVLRAALRYAPSGDSELVIGRPRRDANDRSPASTVLSHSSGPITEGVAARRT